MPSTPRRRRTSRRSAWRARACRSARARRSPRGAVSARTGLVTVSSMPASPKASSTRAEPVPWRAALVSASCRMRYAAWSTRAGERPRGPAARQRDVQTRARCGGRRACPSEARPGGADFRVARSRNVRSSPSSSPTVSRAMSRSSPAPRSSARDRRAAGRRRRGRAITLMAWPAESCRSRAMRARSSATARRRSLLGLALGPRGALLELRELLASQPCALAGEPRRSPTRARRGSSRWPGSWPCSRAPAAASTPNGQPRASCAPSTGRPRRGLRPAGTSAAPSRAAARPVAQRRRAACRPRSRREDADRGAPPGEDGGGEGAGEREPHAGETRVAPWASRTRTGSAAATPAPERAASSRDEPIADSDAAVSRAGLRHARRAYRRAARSRTSPSQGGPRFHETWRPMILPRGRFAAGLRGHSVAGRVSHRHLDRRRCSRSLPWPTRAGRR